MASLTVHTEYVDPSVVPALQRWMTITDAEVEAAKDILRKNTPAFASMNVFKLRAMGFFIPPNLEVFYNHLHPSALETLPARPTYARSSPSQYMTVIYNERAVGYLVWDSIPYQVPRRIVFMYATGGARREA